MGKPFLKNLRQISPYVPGEQPKTQRQIKLNANENPYPPAPGVQQVLRAFSIERLAQYPDANGTILKNALAERYRLSPAQVFLGNGSDDVLALAFQSFFNGELPILYPDITYSFYPVWCRLFNIAYKTVPLDADFRIDPRTFDVPNGGVILPNPNAPTGRAEPLSFIRDIVEHNPDCIVIIDEAYVDFGAESAVPLLRDYDNLLIVQTTSKSRSLAGMRIGYAFGSEILINTLEAVKNSYNSYTMDTFALTVGAASIADETYFQQTCRKIIEVRTQTAEKLIALGFTVCPSQANFLFVTHPRKSAKEILDALKQEGIYVRHFNLPRIDNYLRITIGTPEQMDALITALRKIL